MPNPGPSPQEPESLPVNKADNAPQVDQVLLSHASEVMSSFILTHQDYQRAERLLSKEFQRGLKSTVDSTVRMYLTYVRSLPNSKELGKYLALDLGGTNFRVLLVEFNKETSRIADCEKHEIPLSIRTGPGEALFDFIAIRVVKFAVDHELVGVRIALGFTFSFPLQQHGLAEATLVTWTKSFCCSGVVGYDVVRMLKAALKRKMVRSSIPYVDVVAIINDTTGTLIAGALLDKNCVIGLIVGTGCNACYVEKLSSIEKWPYNYSDPKQVVINTEWGAFGNNEVLEFARTQWDRQMDYESVNPHKQVYEKMISGMYLPEILRRAMISLVERNLLFNGQCPFQLLVADSIGNTKYLSMIDEDFADDNFTKTREVLDTLFPGLAYTATDLRIIYMLNNRITKRAAYLVAVGLWTLIKRIPQTDVSIAYDGSLIGFHPFFKTWVEEKINKFLVDSALKKKIKLVQSQDGSGYGAAIVAAVCYREKRPKIIKRNGKVYELTSVA